MSSPHDLSQPVELVVTLDEAGWRLDALLAHHFSDYSRVLLRRAISAGGVQIDGRGTKPAYRLRRDSGSSSFCRSCPAKSPRADIPLEILYQDEWMAAVNKPPGMVVHPARGHWSGTLAGAIQYHLGQMSSLGGPTRPGIVHRLDRDTSGVILVARNDRAHARLSEQFQRGRSKRSITPWSAASRVWIAT